ncbi:MAG: N-acetyltransferase [Candidatus Cloacimonetes bacterium]|nr:N-acetyltransferase [Candidatus Cloacimonadota bacterium]
MEFRAYKPVEAAVIQDLFVSVFSKSEGEQEGVLIGNLVDELVAGTGSQDLHGFVAVDGKKIVGAIFFSRLSFEQDVDVFILAPVAVHSDHQGMGIGQALINHGLQEMKKCGVRFVTTYGAPSFYTKVGFHPISQHMIAAPLELSQPEGWLGQSLADDPIETIPGKCKCVKALNNPVYW